MKKLLTLITALCLAMCAMFALTACGSNDVNPAGKTYGYDSFEVLTQGLSEEQKATAQENIEEEMEFIQITFKSDKTFEVNMIGGPYIQYVQNPVQTGTWEADGNKVVLTFTDGNNGTHTQAYNYSDGKFYCDQKVPYGEGAEAQCRIWFAEVEAVA